MTQQETYETYRHTATVNGVGADGLTLLEWLRLGGPGPWTRHGLAIAIDWGDRKLRKQIELLRRAGVPVLSTSGHHAGYRLASSVEEIDAFCKAELLSRIESLESQLSALHQTANLIRANAAQPALFEVPA